MSIRAVKWAMGLGGVDLTPVQRNVLFVLAYHHNHSTGLCCPSVETIGESAGVKERAAREALSALEHVGLIKRQKRTNERGQASNQYVLFGRVKNKTGRHLRAGTCGTETAKTGRHHGAPTGRHHTTGTTGRHPGAGEREYNTSREVKAGPGAVGLKVVAGGRHA